MKTNLYGLAVLLSAAMLVAVPASANTVWSSAFTNSGGNSTLSGADFFVEAIWDSATFDEVTFRLTNNLDVGDGAIAAVYWDETIPDILDFGTLFVQPTGWSSPATPTDFSGNPISPDAFVTQASSDADSGGTDYRIGGGGASGDFTIALDLGAGTWTAQDYEDALLGRLNAGDMRVGIHVQSINPDFVISSDSDWFYAPFDEGGQVVPVPPAAAIGLLGMGLIGVIHARKRKR